MVKIIPCDKLLIETGTPCVNVCDCTLSERYIRVYYVGFMCNVYDCTFGERYIRVYHVLWF